jgi:hypothetical protein
VGSAGVECHDACQNGGPNFHDSILHWGPR